MASRLVRGGLRDRDNESTPRSRDDDGGGDVAPSWHHHPLRSQRTRERERESVAPSAPRRAARPGPSPEAATPHEGYEVIAELLGRFDDPRDAFVFTSNIDGFFRRAGVPAEQLYEARAPGKDNSKRSEEEGEQTTPRKDTTRTQKERTPPKKKRYNCRQTKGIASRRIARSSTPTRLRRRTRGAGFVAARRAMKGSAVLTGAVDRLN